MHIFKERALYTLKMNEYLDKSLYFEQLLK